MKRLFFFICALVLLCSPSSFAAVEWDGTSVPWTKGTGTEADPYLIETPQHLSYLSEMVSAGINTYKDKYFKQTEDFDMKSLVFTPIGTTYFFRGNYNGDNKSISNLTISGDNNNDYIALFGAVSGHMISNVIVDGDFTSSVSGRKYAAGIVAYGLNIKLRNCKNKAKIDVSSDYAAGIMALCAGACIITNCSNTGEIHSNRIAGGLVGEIGVLNTSTIMICTITDCINIGNVYSSYITGGMVGSNCGDTCILEKCSNAGVVHSSATNNSYSGGLIGYNYNKKTYMLNNCSNVGTVYSSVISLTDDAAYAGGIVGYNGSTKCSKLNNCYAHCIVEAKVSIGGNQEKREYAYGITENDTISNSYFAGTLSGEHKYGVARYGKITNSYFNSDCGASTSSNYGTAKTTAQLKSTSMPILLNGSETGTTWVMDTNNSNDGYPIFGWQAAPTYKITVTCDELQGSVNGGGNYTEGTIVTLTATPKEGYIFLGWSDGDKTTPRSVTVGTSDVTYTALFVKMRYVITVNQDCSVNVQ